jgi:hypothetical protein
MTISWESVVAKLALRGLVFNPYLIWGTQYLIRIQFIFIFLYSKLNIQDIDIYSDFIRHTSTIIFRGGSRPFLWCPVTPMNYSNLY